MYVFGLLILLSMKSPKAWSEVTISQHYNLCEAIAMDWETDTDRAIAMVSALSGISIVDLNEKTPLPELKKAIQGISFIGDPKVKGRPSPTFRIGTRRFEVDLILKESSASSFISLADCTKTAEVAKVNIHNVIAVFSYELNWFGFRKKRTAKSQKEIAEFFKNNLTMDKAFIYSGFFLKSWKGLQEATLVYLNGMNRKMMKEVSKIIEQDL